MIELFTHHPDGVEIHFPEPLANWLRDVPALLDSLAEGDSASERLNPPTYLDDPGASAEWRRLMGTELDQARAADRSAFTELVTASTSGVVASREEAEAFLRVLVEGRLVIADRIGVEVEADYSTLAEEDVAVLGMLAELQVMLIKALDG